jgi:cell wall-associated NlpC family hydrolase
MSDPRVTPEVETRHDPAQVILPVVDLLRRPGGRRDRQLLFGDSVTILNVSNTYCLIRAKKDGYCGYLPETALGPPSTPTHTVTAPATHAYSEASIKSPETMLLSFGSLLTATGDSAAFIETDAGHIPRQHLHQLPVTATDPVAIAEKFLGTPYLWGGNSRSGLDCSGLVQTACLACGIPCPGDSDQQEKTLGTPLNDPTALRRNDLIFWKGHVAFVAGPDSIIHANAGYMSTVYESLPDALARIEAAGDGRPTGYRRLIPNPQPG